MDFRSLRGTSVVPPTQAQRDFRCSISQNISKRTQCLANELPKISGSSFNRAGNIISAIKNKNSVRAPQRSMLGTHGAKRESIRPLLRDVKPTPNRNSVGELKISNDSFMSLNSFPNQDDFTLVESHKKRSSISPSSDSSFKSCVDDSDVEKSTSLEKTLTNTLENSFNSSCQQPPSVNIKKYISYPNISISNSDKTLTNRLNKLVDRTHLLSPMNTNSSAIKDERPLSSTVSKIEELQKKDKVKEEDNEDMNRRLMSLIDMLMKRNSEAGSQYQTEIVDLQLKIRAANKEIADLNHLRNMLISKLNDKENIRPNVELNGNQFSAQTTLTSPSRRVVEDLRTSINFLKTPRVSRVPRQSMLLTPHSMSFCIRSQFEQLLK